MVSKSCSKGRGSGFLGKSTRFCFVLFFKGRAGSVLLKPSAEARSSGEGGTGLRSHHQSGLQVPDSLSSGAQRPRLGSVPPVPLLLPRAAQGTVRDWAFSATTSCASPWGPGSARVPLGCTDLYLPQITRVSKILRVHLRSGS